MLYEVIAKVFRYTIAMFFVPTEWIWNLSFTRRPSQEENYRLPLVLQIGSNLESIEQQSGEWTQVSKRRGLISGNISC
jgi:hypothetical protein